MSPRLALAGLVSVATIALGASADSTEGNPAGAEKQYRIARRLAAENSPEAAPALRKVLELDPEGPLADDALVEEALLLGIPLWPEDLGRLDSARARQAEALLGRAVSGFPRGDRAVEGRFRMGLLRLEPLPGRDSGRARPDLLAVATGEMMGEWSLLARYAIAWLDEQEGSDERAAAAHQRLRIDAPDSPAAIRSRVALGRLQLRRGAYGRAAALFQEAVEQETPAELRALPLRELAMRALLREVANDSWSQAPPKTIATGLRGALGPVRFPDGGILIADRRSGAVRRLDSAGRPSAQWTMKDVGALAIDPFGRAFLAAGERLYRLDGDGPQPVAELGKFAPVSAVAADSTGRLWVVDRKGDRIGRIDPGSVGPEIVRESRGAGIAAMVWDGRRLVVVEERLGRLLEIRADGTERPIGSYGLKRPIGLAADPAGQLAVLESKADDVLLLGPDGEVRDRLPTSPGFDRAGGIALGMDGSLDILDEASGNLVRLP